MDVVAAVFTDQEYVLACRRRPHLSSGGRWEFPGGKVEAGETPEAALLRELREEVGLELCRAKAWPVLEGPIRLHPFLVEVEGEPRTPLAWGWFTAPEMLRLPLPPRNKDLVARLAPADLIG